MSSNPQQPSDTPTNNSGELQSPLLLNASRGSNNNSNNFQSNESKRFQQDDQIEILDYSEDAAAQALYGVQIIDTDPSTTLIPKVPNLTQVVRYLHSVPGNIDINDIYGQYVKTAKVSSSESLNSYPKHVDPEVSSTLQTSQTNFTDPTSGVTLPVHSASYHKQLQSTLSTLGQPGIQGPGQNSRTLSSLEGIPGGSSLMQAINGTGSGQAGAGSVLRMGSISVTPDGTYLLDQGLSDALVDNLYTELSESMGLEFVQYVQTSASIATQNETNQTSPDSGKSDTALPNSHPGGVISTSLPDNAVGGPGHDDDGHENLFVQGTTGSQPNETNPFLTSLPQNDPTNDPNHNQLHDSVTQALIDDDDDVQVLHSQRIRTKTVKLVSKRKEHKVLPPIVLSKKSLISPSTIYNAHNPEIDNILQQQYTAESKRIGGGAATPATAATSSGNSEADYQQPTFEPCPAPVGASITQTKDSSTMIFINNVDEPLSKTTFEQISFLGGFWPQAARFIVCGILGVVMACITWIVQWIVGHMVKFLHWVMTAILQQQGGVIGYTTLTYALWPILAMIAASIVVVIYWLPGVAMVYWAGIFAVKGSGLPALNAYFDGSYDQNVPLFGTKVLFAKLISVTLSLGGLLKGGLQGPLIHVGAMVARMTLKTTLKLLNTSVANQIAVICCCCCFDRYGHARKLQLPWNRNKKGKTTSYIQSQQEKEDGVSSGLSSPSESVSNQTEYKQQEDTNDYYDDNQDEQWYDIDRELREQQIQRLSPPRIGDSTDVETEMQNRINIYAHGVNLQHSNIISFRQNEENRLLSIKKHREAQINRNNATSLVSTPNSPNAGSPGTTTTTTTNPQQSPPETLFQFHNASRIATASQLPSSKGNDFSTVSSLTLSSRLELIVRSLSGPQDEHDALACGATAGFTCAFNAPLAGMVMIQSMIKQQSSFQLTLRMFFTALVSVLVSNLLTAGANLPDRGFVDLDIPPIHPMPSSELYLCVVLGVIGGLLGVFIIKFNVFLTKYRVKWYHDKLVPNMQLTILLAMLMIIPGILITVATSCTPINEESFPLCIEHPLRCMQLGCPKDQFSQLGSLMFGTPDRLLHLAWDRSNDPANEFSSLPLAFFFVVYIVLASASFLGAFPGGFFVPGILIGAMFGRLFSRLINYFFFPYYNLTPGVYATLGSVAMLASVNRVTLPIVAMMVEFTSDVQFLTPIMIIILSAKFIADFFCLGLEPEVGRLQPRVTMALGEAANPVMGHINAKDVLSINMMLQSYPSFSLNDELYPGHSDLAMVGEIDSIHRLQALLETTTHSAFPVVSVLPSHITSCQHTQGLAQRVYQRSLLKSLHFDDSAGKQSSALKLRTLSSLPSSASLLGSISALNFNTGSSLGQAGMNFNGSVLGQPGYTFDPHNATSSIVKDPTISQTLQTLQPYHDDVFAQCPCQNLQAGYGKFVGLVTRRSLRMLIDKSVDFSRATRVIGSGNHSRLYRGNSSSGLAQLGTNTPSSPSNSSNTDGVNATVSESEDPLQQSQPTRTWYQKLTAKFSKNVNTTDTPGSVDSVTAQIEGNKRAEQLDLISDKGDNMKATDQGSKKSKYGTPSSTPHSQNHITCQCLTCTTHRWALIRYHNPVLALFQHQMTKRRVLAVIANIYFQTGVHLRGLYKQSYHHLTQLSPQFQQQLSQSKVPTYLLSICHPVLVHRELLSTALNFVGSMIRLPKLPQHLQETIFRLAQLKADESGNNVNKKEDATKTTTTPTDTNHSIFSAAQQQKRQQQQASGGIGGTTVTTTTAATATAATAAATTPPPVPVASLTRQLKNKNNSSIDQSNDEAFEADFLFVPSFIRFVTWLEERSQVRYSLNKEHVTKKKDNASAELAGVYGGLNRFNANNGDNTGMSGGNGPPLSAASLCVSLVNTLPLTDTGVYVGSHSTTAARLWRLFRTAGMAKIVIVNDNHEPIGIITRKDIVRADRYLTGQMNGLKTKFSK